MDPATYHQPASAPAESPRGGHRCRTALAGLVVLGSLLTSGCKSMQTDDREKQPRTVTEFMKQQRPGNGVLGP